MTDENLTPAQKGAITRAANKARAAEQDKLAESIPVVVEEVAEQINDVADSELVAVAATQVTPKIPAKVRNVIYTLGIYLGVFATVAQVIGGITTGEAQLYLSSAGTLALSLTNLLAKLNLSKTADDIAAAS